jgi:hypothetical protein
VNKRDKLISIGSQSIGSELPDVTPQIATKYGLLGEELGELLKIRNGFYAFEAALHLLPSQAKGSLPSLEQWNSRQLWRNEYRGLADDQLFFAEDAFGNQFCVHKGTICLFEAETGECRELAKSFEDWAALILDDYEFQTGYPLLHQWQLKNGNLPVGQRLIAKFPFVLGGAYSLDNLAAMDCVEIMRARGNIAWQLRDVPEGTNVEICLDDYPGREKH